jgi:hypothetical protein
MRLDYGPEQFRRCLLVDAGVPSRNPRSVAGQIWLGVRCSHVQKRDDVSVVEVIMVDLIADPTLYLLFVTAYVVGFVDLEDPSDRTDFWGYFSDASFWGAIVLAIVLFQVHGPVAGGVALIGGWAAGIAGFRRGILAQRNMLWETALWTMSLGRIIAAASPRRAQPLQPKPVRKPNMVRGIQWQLPTMADLIPGRGRRLTIMGVAMDMAACFVVMSALSVLIR